MAIVVEIDRIGLGVETEVDQEVLMDRPLHVRECGEIQARTG